MHCFLNNGVWSLKNNNVPVAVVIFETKKNELEGKMREEVLAKHCSLF